MASFRGQFEDAGFIIQVLSRVLTQLIDVNQKVWYYELQLFCL